MRGDGERTRPREYKRGRERRRETQYQRGWREEEIKRRGESKREEGRESERERDISCASNILQHVSNISPDPVFFTADSCG